MKPRMIVIAALALLGVFLLTPQGGALAQSLFQFFTIAESDVIVLPTATPTTSVSETKESLSPTETPAAQEVFWDISESEAESLAGFKLREPASLPAGYSRDVIVYGSETGSVTQIYKFYPYQSGELFTLTQSPALKVDVVGSSASVDVLQVGGRSVEVISGIWWEGAPGSGVEEWVDDSPVHTFRWEEDGVYITVQFWIQDAFSPAYLTEEDMLTMIEVVMGARETFPVGTNLNNLRSIAEAEEVAGYAILEPTVLPEGFTFQYASYEPELSRVILFYYYGEVTRNSSNRLLIFETPLEEYTQGVWDGYPPEAIEEVSFGGQTGTYVRGLIISGAYDPNEWQRLEWDSASLHINMRFDGEQTLMDQAQMVQVAESME